MARGFGIGKSASVLRGPKLGGGKKLAGNKLKSGNLQAGNKLQKEGKGLFAQNKQGKEIGGRNGGSAPASESKGAGESKGGGLGDIAKSITDAVSGNPPAEENNEADNQEQEQQNPISVASDIAKSFIGLANKLDGNR